MSGEERTFLHLPFAVKSLFITNVKGTFLGMCESEGHPKGAETATGLPCDLLPLALCANRTCSPRVEAEEAINRLGGSK